MLVCNNTRPSDMTSVRDLVGPARCSIGRLEVEFYFSFECECVFRSRDYFFERFFRSEFC